jgi:hypothetical protein
MKNINKLCRDFDYKGYVLLKKNRKLFIYISSNRSSWPFNITEVIKSLI